MLFQVDNSTLIETSKDTPTQVAKTQRRIQATTRKTWSNVER